MKGLRFLMVTKKIFWNFRHDKRSLALMLLAPILSMMVFGIAFSGDMEDVKVVIVNLDQGYRTPVFNQSVKISQSVISNMDRDVLDISYSSSIEDGLKGVEDGTYYSLIIFPENFTMNIMAYKSAMASGNVTAIMGTTEHSTVSIRSDQAEVSVVSEVNRLVMQAIAETMEQGGFDVPIDVDASDPVYGEGATFIDMFIPGIMGFTIFLLTTTLSLITFVGERTQGTLYRLMATPITEGEIILGYALAFSILGMAQVALLIAIAVLVFDVMVVGNLLLTFLIGSMLGMVSVSLGILLSSLARRESQAIQFYPLIVMPTFLLAGIFWPLESIPAYLRPLSYGIPVTYAIKGLRSVMVRGWGVAEIWPQLLALTLFATAFLLGAVLTLKMERRRA